MKYVAAYALLVLGGKASPSEDDVKGLLQEIGANIDEAGVKEVVKALHGKNLPDVIAEGMKQVQTLSVGGGNAAPVAATKAPVQKEAAKVVEKAPEPEEDMDMGGLFD